MAVDLSDVNAVIEKNMAAFDKPGVLSVRPGFKVTKDWLTNTKSIVVTVRHKVAQPPQGEMLPAEVGGVPVDVRQASPEKALELEDPQKYARATMWVPESCEDESVQLLTEILRQSPAAAADGRDAKFAAEQNARPFFTSGSPSNSISGICGGPL